jgi:putative FmdB family regulatory protein
MRRNDIRAEKEEDMPIYEYKCPSCGRVFEDWVTSHETTPHPCPECGVPAPHIVSPTTFVLKGGGWYVTEYGNRRRADGAGRPDVGAPAQAAGAADASGKAAQSESPAATAPEPAGPETASAA